MTARVLVIEDNPINRELLDYLLQAYGFKTLQAVDGGVGFDIARRERPDLILCDIQMSGTDGFAFARLAKADEVLRATPLVAVTAYAMVGDHDRILAAGFDGYLAKPIDAQELIRTVNAHLAASQRVPATAPQPSAAPAAARTGRSPRVLVLDDSPFNLELKRDLLSPHGYEVLTADNVAQAWEIAKQQAPALIISDVGMSEGSGFDFIRCVKADAQLRDIPFIFLSSTHWDETSKALGLQLGAFRYLQRPLESALLLAEIRACVPV